MAKGTKDKAPAVAVAKKDRAVVADYEARYLSGEWASEKQSYEKLWFQCLSFYTGNQWSRWNPQFARLEEPPAPPWRKKYTANLILPMVMRIVAKLTADRPEAVVVPNTPDRDDVQGARVSTKVLDHLMRVTEFDTELRRMVEWATICGTGFLKVYWDPDAGPRTGEVMDFAESLIMREAEDAKESSTKGKASVLDRPIGEIRVDPVSPFKIFTDARTAAPGWDDATWVCEATTRPLDYIKQKWAKGDKVAADSGGSGMHGFLEKKMRGMVSGIGSGWFTTPKDSETAVVLEMWDRPSTEYPRGRYAVVANGVVLENRANAFTEIGSWNPYIYYPFIEVPGRFWGMGLVENLMAPQREYNVTRSQIIESKNLMSKPKWVVPKGSGVPDNAITSEPGEVIEYNANWPAPQVVPPVPLPNYVEQHVTNIIREMQMIAAQSDVTQSKAPPNVRSGVAIQLLQEGDQSVLSLPRKRLVDMIMATSQLMLKLAQANWSLPRVVKTVASDYSYQVERFFGADIRNNYDVRLVPYSRSGMESSAARRQNLMDIMGTGFLNPQEPSNLRSVMEAFELYDPDSALFSASQHFRVAERENDQMRAMPPVYPEVRDFHDHTAHLAVLDSFRNSAEYQTLDQMQREMFDRHAMGHQQALAQIQQAQMEQMMASRGTPSEPGQASPPSQQGGEREPTE